MAKCGMLFFLCFLAIGATAQQENESANPFTSEQPKGGLPFSELKRILAERLASPFQNAVNVCATADLMKRLGDSRTEDYYRKCIALDPREPAYELFYGDYLRNFRGPNRPLFSQAETHYMAALRKLRDRTPKPWDAHVRSRVLRALVALHQEDGITLSPWSSQLDSPETDTAIPQVFFASINRYAQSPADLDREPDDIRDYTSEALLSESRNPSLRLQDLKALLRTKQPFVSFNRLRLRYRALPSLDVFYAYHQTPNEAVTDFGNPSVHNGFILNQVGTSAEKAFSIARNLDVNLTGTFRLIRQQGLLEDRADKTEKIREFETTMAVSRFLGPDKLILEGTLAHQFIHTEAPDTPDRGRGFVGGRITYQLLRPEPFHSSVYDRHLDLLSWDFFGGFLLDNEDFNNIIKPQSTTVIRRDYYAGVSLNGVGAFDLTIQPTIFSSSSSSKIPASNSQYRTNATLVWRVVDEECGTLPWRNSKTEECSAELPATLHALNLAFWHISLPLRHDVAIDNLDFFENYEAGIESDWKLYNASKRTAILISLGYAVQRFYKLDSTRNNFNVAIKLGF
jgi:hypothetical protein